MGKMPGAHTEMTDGPSCKHCMRPWPLTRRSGLSPLANTLKAILHGTSVPIPELSSLESDLFCGSWIDEHGSAPGVDLGTWIGEPEENRGWQLLARTREFLAKTRYTPASAPLAFAALSAAEGSDWFWWFGSDQDSDADADFDDYFLTHIKSIYRLLHQP